MLINFRKKHQNCTQKKKHQKIKTKPAKTENLRLIGNNTINSIRNNRKIIIPNHRLTGNNTINS